MASNTTTRDIGVLVYPNCLRSGVVIPSDVFRVANSIMQFRPAAERIVFRCHWLSARDGSVVKADGMQFDVEPLAGRQLDALVLPGIDHRSPQELENILGRLAPEQNAITAYARSGRPLISSCSSTCLVAQAGLLDGHRATTSWWLGPLFRSRYPAVQLELAELVVQDRAFVSSGGVTSCLDLALWVVGHFGGEELRQITAKVLVMDPQRVSQAPYIADALEREAGQDIVGRARHWLNQRLDQAWSASQLAAACNTSQRTLLRRFREIVGMTPASYVQQLRIDRAKVLLETSMLSTEIIAGRCGYKDVSTFGRIFKRLTHLTPREYRQRFALRP